MLFSNELGRKLEGTGVTTYSLHPGVVRTELGRHIEKVLGIFSYPLYGLIYFFTKNSKEGAQTSIYCAVEESIAKDSGKYYSDCAEREPQPLAKDTDLAKKLWEISETTVGL